MESLAGVAQVVEQLLVVQEVDGSTPFTRPVLKCGSRLLKHKSDYIKILNSNRVID